MDVVVVVTVDSAGGVKSGVGMVWKTYGSSTTNLPGEVGKPDMSRGET